jgi:predicted nucleotidyltransferase
VRTSDIPVERLDHILTDYFPPDTKADVLSIDIEGLNFQVLKLNNWDLYKPQCVLVESLETS